VPAPSRSRGRCDRRTLQRRRRRDGARTGPYHHEQALNAPQALPYLRRALQQAMLRQAPREVLAVCNRALALLPSCEGRIAAASLTAWRAEFLSGRPVR
jgi:hypothetical protein